MKVIGKRIGWMLAIGLLAISMLLFAAACDDDDDDNGSGNGDQTPVATEDGNGNGNGDDLREVEDIFRETAESDATNADFVFEHVTDNFIETVFFSNREDCMANFDECVGEPSGVENISDTAIDGDTATLIATLDFGTFEFGLVREDGVWKVDSMQATTDDIPEGAAIIDLMLGDFVFGFDETVFPSDGNFGFAVTNAGAQPHEVAVAPVPADADLMEAVESIEDPSAVVGLKLFIRPGQEVDMAFEAPLDPGRYALVCFFPDITDPEGTSHYLLGMLDEFTIE